MNLSIKQTTHFAIDTLEKHQRGTVHSIYRRTINLSFDGQLLALQADHSPVSPISFITALDPDRMEALNISVNDQVIVSKNKLTIIGNHENYSFRYGQAKVDETKFVPNLKYEEIDRIRTDIKKVLSQVNTNGLDQVFNKELCIDSPLAIQVAGKRIESGIKLLSEDCFDEAATELSRLIGLGSGLTPSGDDFLCGLLAGAAILKMEQHPFFSSLKTLITEHLQDTIDISAAFLACALQNEFSLAVNSLETCPSIDEMRERFLAIGHSSGIDTLCGVYFALDNFKVMA